MSRFRNLKTGVVVSVADDKDSRFASGWESVTDAKPQPKRSATKSDSK